MKWLNLIPQRLDRGATPTFAGLLAGDGTAAAPSISFASTPTTGFYKDSNGFGFSRNGQRSFSIGGNGALYGAHSDAQYVYMPSSGAVSIVAAGSQNITLTPSGPGANLLGNNTLLAGNANAGASWRTGTLVAGVDGYDKVIAGHLISSTNGAVIGAHGSAVSSWTQLNVVGSTVVIRTNGEVEALRVHANQRVGIGTGVTDSGALLQIGTDLTTKENGIVFGTDTFLHRRLSGAVSIAHATQPQLYLTDLSGNIHGYVLGSTNLLRIGGNNVTAQTRIDSGGAQACIFDTAQGATFTAGITTGGSIVCAAGGTVQWNGRSAMGAPSDGVIRLTNNGGSDFTRLQFGGVSASFPALARNGTDLWVRLANDGGWSNIAAATIVATSAAGTTGANQVSYGGTTATTVGAAGGASALPATPTGYIIINVAGTPAKLPYYAA